MRQAVLVLEDGSIWKGRGFGACARVTGEVVFNTGMVGYPESITDPSYRGQILCQTYPLIGNYGVSPSDFESPIPRIQGYVVAEHCQQPSHSSSRKSLDEWLKENGIPGLSGVDTRALTKRLRTRGVMLGILEAPEHGQDLDVECLLHEASSIPDPNERDLVSEVSLKKAKIYNPAASKTAVLIDCGAKENIIRCLVGRGFKVFRVPASADFRQIMNFSPSGIVLSNGPGDPTKCADTIRTVRKILAEKIPVFGICLGNQILALAAGAGTFKLKFGHRSQNQPCLEEGTGRCYITSQNHGYAVDARTLPRGWKAWFTNANDDTNEGIIHRNKPFMSVQFHPEASPGPMDTEFLFDRFRDMAR